MASSLSRIGCSFGSSGMRAAGESVMLAAEVEVCSDKRVWCSNMGEFQVQWTARG